MSRYNLTLQRLDRSIEQSIRFDELVFTSKKAELLASKLAKQGLNTEKAAATLANLISEHEDLRTAVTNLQGEKSKLEGDIGTKKAQQEGIIQQLDALREQV